jgi:hypothetical protein
MGLMDKLTAGAERAAREAEKAFDKGKSKVGELQIEMQLDSSAKKLGYIVFDFYRGRQVDQAQRQKLLDEMSRLEDQLIKARSEAATKTQADTGAAAQSADARPAGAADAADATEAPAADASPTAEAQETTTPPVDEPWPQADA